MDAHSHDNPSPMVSPMVVSQRSSVSEKVQYVFNGEPHYSVGNMQLCDDIAQLQGALDRSGAVLPLTIKFENTIWEGNSRVIASALLQILSTPISERIQDLNVAVVSIQNAEYGIDVPIGPFPLLRSVILPSDIGPWTHRFLESVSSTSRSLNLVVLTGVVSPELAAHSFWHRVERVVLSRRGLHLNELNLLAPQLRSLEHVEGLPYDWPTQNTAPVVWENILQLSLSCDPRYLQLPRLETFTLYETGPPGQLHPLSEYGQISYPALGTLDVEIKSPLWPRYTAGAFPALLTLTLKCGQNDEVIVDILNSVPTVLNLRIIVLGPPRKTFGSQILQDLQSDKEPLVCPNLERLTLGESKFGVRTLKSNNGPFYKSVVEFRREIGRPLQELTVYWAYHKEVIDYAIA